MLSYPQPTRLVVHLNIDLPPASTAIIPLVDALRTLMDLPGATVTVHDAPPVPSPRRSTQAGRLRIVPHSRTVLRHDIPVNLTRLEFDLLLFLARRPDRVHRRSTILADVWGVIEPLHTRTVDVHIRRLRNKLGADCTLITTVRGVGYRFDGADGVVIEPAPAHDAIAGRRVVRVPAE